MPEQKKEKLDFLKREEIKTMAKDLAFLRELEAQKQREKIASIKLKEDSLTSKQISEQTKDKSKKIFSIQETPKTSSQSKKILVRGIIVLLFVLFLGIIAWFFWPKEKTSIPEAEEEISEPVVEEPEIRIPVSLIPIEKTKTPEISNIEEISTILKEMIQEEMVEGEFLRVAIKNIKEKRLVSFEELSTSLGIEVPEEMYQKIDEDYTLVFYSQAQGKRVALIAKVKEHQGLIEVLKNWETQMLKKEIVISEKSYPFLVPSFKTSFYKDIGLRYLTISKNDFGLCYAYFDNYFLVTSSFESFKKIIDKIDKIEEQETNNQIGQLFIVGFDGKVVTPQLEEFFKKYKPGGVLLLSKNIENETQLKKLNSDLQALSLRESGLPLFIAVDQEGGIISRVDFLQEKTAQFEIETAEQAFLIGQKRGQALKELGINLNLAPVLDSIQEGDFLFERSFQKPIEEIGELGKALIQGQKTADILTAMKHFPGYGTISFHPEETLARVEQIPEISQFKKAMEANPELVMTSNVIYKEIDNSLPLIFSPDGIQFLKNNLGINVLIVSDDLDQNSLLTNFSLKEIVIKPIEAGVDIIIFSGWRSSVEQALETFLAALEINEISETSVNNAVSKIINFKQNNL